jgi:hypothetical protein
VNKGIIISLCDYTGKFVEPWVTFGYTALLVDPQHEDFGEGNVLKFPGTVLEAMPVIELLIATGKVVFVMGFPPCTDVAVSGARWWPDKYHIDPYFQAKASLVAKQCRVVGMLSGAPWVFENPVSAFSSIFGEPNHSFSPYDYSAYCEADQYFKKTCLWSGGGFIMPEARHKGALGKPDERIFRMSPGEDRQNNRSATPAGFSIAVFLANCPDFRGQTVTLEEA